ncbi:zinc-regulated transporter 2 [Diutina catenulata]
MAFSELVAQALVHVQEAALTRRHVPIHFEEAEGDEPVECPIDNEYDGCMGVRISSVFVILVGGGIGVFLPILSSRYSFIRMPWWCFFIFKYFGSGVIVATGLIHLLEPAADSLGAECLGGTLSEYPWAYGICLMSLFALFFAELVAYRWVDNKVEAAAGHSHSHFGDESLFVSKHGDSNKEKELDDASASSDLEAGPEPAAIAHTHSHAGTQYGVDTQGTAKYPSHFSHAEEHQDPEVIGTLVQDHEKETYYGQLLQVFVLEFGILFHSVFVGLAMAVAGDEFITLYIVLIFHQMFEGFGLGSRIALTNWGKKVWTPWLLGLAFTLVTPIAIAIGLGVRSTYAPGSRKALITNGVFDAISAGILIYTGLIELMAHEFLFSNEFKGQNGFKKMLWAFFIMCWGAGLMALLGRWA